jgi:glycosyltransferase involved in cell wall biosynthesis
VTGSLPEARLALVGDGPGLDGLRRSADESVTFAGETHDVAHWLAAADVVAFPSRWEGMSIALLEAMASGRSVVATDVPGAREALGEPDQLVPAEDPAALAEAIAARLTDPSRAAAEGRAARERAERMYPLRATRDAVAGLYLELLGRGTSSSTGPSAL